MTTFTTRDRVLASIAGAAFTTGALIILIGPAVTTPSAWTQYHYLTILAVAGTIYTGHSVATAKRARAWLAMVGYLTVFLAGTSLVVYNSVGGQAEKAGASIASAEHVNAAIDAKRAELAAARDRKARAEQMADAERGKNRCGPKCQGWEQVAADIKVAIRTLEGELAALGPQRAVNVKAERMAEVLALFDADAAKAEAILTLIEPFLWTLFFEIGSIVSFGFAFRHGAQANDKSSERKADATGSDQTSFPVRNLDLEPTTGTGVKQFLAGVPGSTSPTWVPPGGSGPKGGTRKTRSEPQRRANLIAKELRERGEVPKFHIVRNEYRARYGAELPKVTAHRAVS